jgi:ABC-type multidrug transport system permease subunit
VRKIITLIPPFALMVGGLTVGLAALVRLLVILQVEAWMVVAVPAGLFVGLVGMVLFEYKLMELIDFRRDRAERREAEI